MNNIEKIRAIVAWYDHQNASLSEGLKSIGDAIRLYKYANHVNNQHLPEMADSWPANERIRALDYDPMN